jgi:peptidoglycan-N-acetylglucosamine deacetylase
MNKNLLLVSIFLVVCCKAFSQEQSSLCFTFDDGNPYGILKYRPERWNRMILNRLQEHHIHAVMYVCGGKMDNPAGRAILESWDHAGHLIANHTYNHQNYNDETLTASSYETDVLRCDTLIRNYRNYAKYFRAPYLKYGNTKAKRDSLNEFLQRTGYRNGYVTIDASDWYYNARLVKFMKEHPGKSIGPLKKAYINHLLDRARYYDDLALRVLGRKIRHSILLHHNLTSALFLGDLMKAFETEGWKIIDAREALADPAYERVPDIVPAGESLIWGLAKETHQYDDILRYPGEDSRYEEEKLNKIGF